MMDLPTGRLTAVLLAATVSVAGFVAAPAVASVPVTTHRAAASIPLRVGSYNIRCANCYAD